MNRAEHQALWERERRRRGTLLQLGIEPLVSRFNPEGARPHRHLEPLPQSPQPAELSARGTDKSGASGSATGVNRLVKAIPRRLLELHELSGLPLSRPLPHPLFQVMVLGSSRPQQASLWLFN